MEEQAKVPVFTLVEIAATLCLCAHAGRLLELRRAQAKASAGAGILDLGVAGARAGRGRCNRRLHCRRVLQLLLQGRGRKLLRGRGGPQPKYAAALAPAAARKRNGGAIAGEGRTFFAGAAATADVRAPARSCAAAPSAAATGVASTGATSNAARPLRLCRGLGQQCAVRRRHAAAGETDA